LCNAARAKIEVLRCFSSSSGHSRDRTAVGDDTIAATSALSTCVVGG